MHICGCQRACNNTQTTSPFKQKTSWKHQRETVTRLRFCLFWFVCLFVLLNPKSLTWRELFPLLNGNHRVREPGTAKLPQPLSSAVLLPRDPVYLQSIQKHTSEKNSGFSWRSAVQNQRSSLRSRASLRRPGSPGLRLCGCSELVNTGAMDKVPDDITGNCLLLSLY